MRSTAAGVLGGSSDNLIGDGEQDLEFVAGAAVLSTALLAARGARPKARGGEVAGERGVTEFEDRPLQRIGVSKEAAEATGAGQGEGGCRLSGGGRHVDIVAQFCCAHVLFL